MESCGENKNNSYCFCLDENNNSIPQYRQYTSLGYSCCDKLNYQPSKVAEIYPFNLGTFTNVYEYIEANTSEETCDYTKFYGGKTGVQASVNLRNNYQLLYENAVTSMEIFNTFFCKAKYENTKYANIIENNKTLIPVINDNRISCSLSNFVPRSLNYKNKNLKTENFTYICYPKDFSYPSLLNTEYSVYSVGQNTKTSSISLDYPTQGISLGETVHTNKKENYRNLIIILCVSLLLALLLIIIIVVFKNGKSRRNEKREKGV